MAKLFKESPQNYLFHLSLRVRSGLLLVFLKKVLLGHFQGHLFASNLWVLLHDNGGVQQS